MATFLLMVVLTVLIEAFLLIAVLAVVGILCFTGRDGVEGTEYVT